ncbi:MAG TPA: multiheme c-type cytochrome [Verrucomicrobiae bacterium]|nr:multiheme c-type cytochrome [Verrucomicrobiae bacterium]
MLLVLTAIILVPGASVYYRYSGGQSCARCHEIWQPYTDWHASTHRNVPCSACHGDVFTLDAGFHLKNISRLAAHLRNRLPEQVRLKTDDVQKMALRCSQCHQQEFADWSASPHSATFREIFLDPTHNRQQPLMDDCLRCHGSYFSGGIRDLVSPLDTKGPWRLLHPELANQPAVPCLACHQMHRQGSPLERPQFKPLNPGPSQEILRPSLALFDRRELDYVSVHSLPLPAMHDGNRLVPISPDIRQALCYQCHAPLAAMNVGSGDDRTPIGVHEGLSCFACHQGHGLRTRASCSTCHPQLSNCGLNVETMDTTFKSVKSPHNIHFVKCIDCHTTGVPRRKARTRAHDEQLGPPKHL